MTESSKDSGERMTGSIRAEVDHKVQSLADSQRKLGIASHECSCRGLFSLQIRVPLHSKRFLVSVHVENGRSMVGNPRFM